MGATAQSLATGLMRCSTSSRALVSNATTKLSCFSRQEIFYQTNAQLSFGSHTERFAYYASVNGNRSDLGLQPPTSEVVHDATNGYGGFGSLIFNVDPSNQLRFVTSLRKDYYQIPYDPNPNDVENAPIP